MKTKFQPKLKTIEDKLWKITRAKVFETHGTDCYTCPQRNLVASNLQCGHGFPKGALGASMKFDLRILRPQCYNCNINHGGMGAAFWKNLEQELGKKPADKLFLECARSKGNPIKARDHYLQLIEEYKRQLNQSV